MIHGYGSNFILVTLRKSTSFQQENMVDPKKELRDYLETLLEFDVKDLVKWWRVSMRFMLLFISIFLILLVYLVLQPAIPYIICHGMRLSCNSRIICSIRTCILEHQNY